VGRGGAKNKVNNLRDRNPKAGVHGARCIYGCALKFPVLVVSRIAAVHKRN